MGASAMAPPDPVGVADGVEVENVVDVDAARGEDLDVPEAVAVELPADFAHQVPEVAAAVARRVHPDRVDRIGYGPRGDQRAELLVVEGVDDDGARHLWVDDLVEGAGCLGGRAEDEDEGVGGRPRGGDAEALRRPGRRRPCRSRRGRRRVRSWASPLGASCARRTRPRASRRRRGGSGPPPWPRPRPGTAGRAGPSRVRRTRRRGP